MIVDVDVSFDLAQLSTSDLLAELRGRRSYNKEDLSYLSITDMIKELRQLGCTEEIIEKLENWGTQPVANLLKLKKWKDFCGVAG